MIKETAHGRYEITKRCIKVALTVVFWGFLVVFFLVVESKLSVKSNFSLTGTNSCVQLDFNGLQW